MACLGCELDAYDIGGGSANIPIAFCDFLQKALNILAVFKIKNILIKI